MQIWLALITLLLGSAAAAVSDLTHMKSCVTSVRSVISDGGEEIDSLYKKANYNTDTVLLYLLRMCYYHHDRSSVEYDMSALLSTHKTKVDRFTQKEFDLITEVTREEAINQSLYKDRDTGESLFESMNPFDEHPWILFLASGFLAIGLPLLWTISKRKPAKVIKQ